MKIHSQECLTIYNKIHDFARQIKHDYNRKFRGTHLSGLVYIGIKLIENENLDKSQSLETFKCILCQELKHIGETIARTKFAKIFDEYNTPNEYNNIDTTEMQPLREYDSNWNVIKEVAKETSQSIEISLTTGWELEDIETVRESIELNGLILLCDILAKDPRYTKELSLNCICGSIGDTISRFERYPNEFESIMSKCDLQT